VPAERLSQRCAAFAGAIALLALAGWLSGARLLAGQWGGAIPMAPSSAWAFLFLSAGVFSQARWPGHRLTHYFAPVLGGIPALLGLLVLVKLISGIHLGVERALAQTNESFGGIPLGRMAPMTAATLLAESGALLLLSRASQWRWAGSMAAILALAASVVNVVVVVGYCYGAPLLYGGATIPTALPTALAFLLLGVGQLKLALPTVPAWRAWGGDSTRGVLLRAFLPPMLLLILLEGWLNVIRPAVASLNRALWHSMTALVACVLIVAITGWVARRTGDGIERAKEALRESEARLRGITESAQDAILMMDPRGAVTYWNPAAESIFGYTSEEAMGKDLHQLLVPERYRDAHREAFPEFLRTGRGNAIGKTLEVAARCKDGREIAVDLSLSSIHRDDGWHSVGILRDVTERQQAAGKLREEVLRKEEVLAELAGANAELEAFAYSVSHDLRAPLRHIRGFTQMLEEEAVERRDTPAQTLIGRILHSEDRMRELIDGLLEFSRLGRCLVDRQHVDLAPLVNAVIEELSLDAQGRPVEWSVAPLPWIDADPRLLRVVMVNLLSNALKFTGGRDPARIAVFPVDGSHRVPVIAVQDNGAGFHADDAHRLFGVFQRLHSQEEFEGTGIGLATVKRIVDKHAGRIWAEGEPGVGATFFFSLGAAV
jgi:PAS domain S-box-containing protein